VAIEIFQTEVGLMSNFNELIADTAALECAVVDPAFEVDRLLREAKTRNWRITTVLVTHTHHDHVDGVEAMVKATGARVYVGAGEVEALQRAAPSAEIVGLKGGETIAVGGLAIEALPTPGHTVSGTSYVVEGNVFTGDTLFKNSVGGVRAPGSTSYEDLRSSIMDTLLTLPPETVIRPGHTEPTTVAEEWETNSFVRVWRGLDPEGEEPCTALGERATLVLLGDDYDGGHKAWVRWPDGRDDIVPGSKVQRG
jgi:hydroxyacylglutathione hydrolase